MPSPRTVLRGLGPTGLVALGMLCTLPAWGEPLAVDPVVGSMVDQVDAATLADYVGGLTGVHPVEVDGAPYTIATRHTAAEVAMQKVTQYLHDFLAAQGIPASYQRWTECMPSRNVIGEKRGSSRPDEVVVLLAHVDDLPSTAVAPGADDNASGVAAVMAAARILGKYGFERTLRFVFVTGEEQGKLGSRRYAEAARASGDNLVAVYTLDVVGWDSDADPVVRAHTRVPSLPEASGDLAMAELFVNVTSAYLGTGLVPVVQSDGFQSSDHDSFWRAGYPAVLIAQDHLGDLNPYHHTANDTLDRLNLTYLTHVTQALVAASAHTAQRSSRPFFLAAGAGAGAKQACVAGIANFDVSVNGDGLSSTTVSMSVEGTPPGSTATVEPAHVVTGGHATIRVALEHTQPGTYPLTVTGSAGEVTHQVPLILRVLPTVPQPPVLVAPANGVLLSTRAPGFGWSASGESETTYQLEVATAPAFDQLVYQATETGLAHVPDGILGPGHTGSGLLAPDTVYYWRVRAINACGTSVNSEVSSFRTASPPLVLLVDDDNYCYDVRSYYTDALDAVGIAYDIWDTSYSDHEPDAATLSRYSAVVWYTGQQVGWPAGPGRSGEVALASYLEDEGRLMFVSSGYLQRPATTFPAAYLNVLGSDGRYVEHLDVTGTALVGSGSYTLSYPTSDGKAWLGMHFTPSNPQSLLYDNGVIFNLSGIRQVGAGAVTKETAQYKTSYWNFPFEALPAADARRESLRHVLDWMVPPGIRGDVDSNGMVSIVDALIVARYQAGLAPHPFDRRLADADCDGVIDIIDALILAKYSAGQVTELCP